MRRPRPRPQRFGMTDHDEMTGCSAWFEHEARAYLRADLARLGAQISGLQPLASAIVSGTRGLAGADEPAVVATIACARCGARGIPTAANWCLRCGGGGNGWAMRDLLPAHAMGVWRSGR